MARIAGFAPLLALATTGLGGCHPGVPADDTAGAFYPPDEPGPYGVSATTMSWTDARGQAMVAEVWYPIPLDPDGSTTCDPKPYPDIPISGRACRDEAPAIPTDTAFPLIAFSHGNAGIRFQSIFLTEALAQHGYVVVAPDHPNNTLLDFDEDQLGTVAERRPGDVSSAVDELIYVTTPPISTTSGADGPLAHLTVQTDHFGMSGHSFGGWTTFATGGGQIHLDALRTFCADPVNVGIDYDFCGVLDHIPSGATDADFAPPDPRVVSNLAMAPAGWYSFDADAVDVAGGLDSVAPTLLMGGTMDDAETIEKEIQPLYDRLTDTRSSQGPDDLAILDGAGHYAFTDICLIGDLQPDCEEEAGGYSNLDDAHAIIDELAIAWFGTTLLGDDRFQPYLDAAGDSAADLEWTAG